METTYLGLFMMGLNPLYWLLVGPAILFALYAQLKVKGAYAQFSRIRSERGYSGAEAARRILDQAGINDVTIEKARGFLSDHYDPKNKVLRLSSEVFEGRSIASIGIAAHESGHALQHAAEYVPLTLRSFLVPVASLGSWLAWPMIFLGFLLHAFQMVQLGIILFTILVVFQIITLPVEFNASSRAKQALTATGIVMNQKELGGVASVLDAAAMTYVAATVTAIVQLVYFLLRSGLLGRR